MGVINMMLKILYDEIGLAVQVLAIRVLIMKNMAHPCCLDLIYSAPALFMVGFASTILKSNFLTYFEDM